MTVEFHSSRAIPDQLAGEWSRLLKGNSVLPLTGGPFWYQLMTANEPGDLAVARNSAGTSVIVLPLINGVMDLRLPPLSCGLRVRLQCRRVCGGEWLVNNVSCSDACELLEHVFRDESANVLLFDHMGVQTASADLLGEAVRASRCLKMVRLYGPIPHYRLVKSGDKSDGRTRSAETLKKIRGRRRAMERQTGASVRIVEVRDRTSLDEYSQHLKSLISRTWQAGRLGVGLDIAGLVELADKKCLRLFMLMCGDAPVAYAECYEGEGVLVYERIGFAPEYGKYSPGSILLSEIVDMFLRDERLHVLDFGEGDALYKRQYANTQVSVQSIVVFRRKLSLGLLFGSHSISQRLLAYARELRGRISGGRVGK